MCAAADLGHADSGQPLPGELPIWAEAATWATEFWRRVADDATVSAEFREIARRALELSASAVILVHNHPSGDPTPSRADIDLTREIERALAPLEIKVHDHLVVGASETISMKAKGLI